MVVGLLRGALCALLFVAWTAESPNDRVLYCGYWRSPFQMFGPLFVSLPGVNLFAWQVLLLAVAPVCLLWPDRFRSRAWPMNAAILTSAASVAVTLLWGLLRGGSAYQAYYQLWRFLAALLVAAMLVAVVRRSAHLKTLGITVLSAALVRGTLAIYFYLAHVRGRIEPPPPHMTSHDDSVLFVAGVLVALSWALARRTWAAWVGAALVTAHLLWAITLNNRRLAWIELMIGLAMVYVMLPRGKVRQRVSWFLLLGTPAILLYVVVGWGRPGALFTPIRAFSTAGSYGDSSSLARLEENRNLIYTFTYFGSPIFGTGWGHPYAKQTSQFANFGAEWAQYLYMPHNSLLGVVAFGGMVGLFGIWLVVPVAAFLATRANRVATRTVDQAATMAAVSILPAYAAQCYGDLGFQSLPCGLVASVAVAAAGKVFAWSVAPSEGPRKARGLV
jgi:hypothetical protein